MKYYGTFQMKYLSIVFPYFQNNFIFLIKRYKNHVRTFTTVFFFFINPSINCFLNRSLVSILAKLYADIFAFASLVAASRIFYLCSEREIEE